ncbi:MAG TPA: hypothetical protein VEV84_08070 [Pyrinomonadaceae bacterium]|nr:hypothetical protein [Pyrinomonadaceae bacterium]
MRNMFGASPQYLGAEITSAAATRDQVSVNWSPAGNVVAAWPVTHDGGSNWEINVERFQTDFNVSQAINLRRTAQGGPQISHDTLFLTTIAEFSERTRILALDGERLALDDRSLVQWLINAEQQVALGTDSHPLFETSLDDTACTIRRLPNGLVSITEVPRVHIQSARERVRTLLGDRITSFLNLTVETPIRTTARYFLTAMKEGELVQRAGKQAEVTAFIIITNAGFRFGLWSPKAGLFSEYGFLAPKEVSQQAASAEAYIRQAFDQLLLQLSKEKLEQLELSGYAQMVWVSEPSLTATVAPIAAEHAASAGTECFHIESPTDEAVVGGLLLASFGFGDTHPVGATVLPPVNLARDLLVLADTHEDERRYNEQIFAQQKRNRAIFTLLGPPVAVFAALLAIIAGLIVSEAVTAVRDSNAMARTQELKPALDRRKSYEANLQWYQEFIKQVSRLRKQQPVGIGLLYTLNSNYPFNIDPAFYVSDIKLQPNGDVEMKGYARNKDSVASLLKTLEFMGGPESGTRLFSNLAYEVQESAPEAAPSGPGQPTLPTVKGALLPNTQTKPGVVAWSITGNYVPMDEFAPPPPTKPGAAPAKPGASPAPAKPGASPAAVPKPSV